MKKTYLKPEFKVVKLQSRTRLLVGSKVVTSVRNNAGFQEDVVGGVVNARSRGDWEDEEFAE